MQYDGGQHPGQDNVDGELCRAEDFPWRVDSEPAFVPDQLVLARFLRLDTVRDRQLPGTFGE